MPHTKDSKGNPGYTKGHEKGVTSSPYLHRSNSVLSGSELIEAIIDGKEDRQSFELPYKGLMEKTKGIRLGELWIFTAGVGIGKSTLLRECAYHFLKSGHRVGMLMLEEPIERTVSRMIGLAIDKPADLLWNSLSEEEKSKGFEATVRTGRLGFYEHLGITDLDTIVEKIRYMAIHYGSQFIVLDHLQYLISSSKERDERLLVARVISTLKNLAMELNIGILSASFLEILDGDKTHEKGLEISLSHLLWSDIIPQFSDFVIGLERDNESKCRNHSRLRVLKNNYTYETGFAGRLIYMPETGRLIDYING
ncbi:DnaB-like helicase C-terminal domain-containing protein [Bartonella sp. DGB2]|uniref:DnaB-like helicase C-terminal domain-containing protein n=1 Tax=Bartonella sp. DGB2 TaxID=3388426 RepID=UPI00398FCA98